VLKLLYRPRISTPFELATQIISLLFKIDNEGEHVLLKAYTFKNRASGMHYQQLYR